MNKSSESRKDKEMLSYYQTHKKQHLESCKRWRENNPDKVTQNNQKFYQTHPDYNKQYYEEHKEEMRERQKEYKEEHKEYYQDYNQDYYENHKDELKEKSKQWREANKDKRREQAARYYKRKKQQKNQKKMIPYNDLAKKYQHNKIPEHEEYEGFENGDIWSWKYYVFKRARKRSDGYYTTSLMVNTKDSRDFMVSRLIASTFDDRPIEQLDQLDCHHCNLMPELNNIQNLVFLPKDIHESMHNNLSIDLIKSIGEQVKQLRGTAKTEQFCRLVKKELRDFYMQKFKE